MVQTATTLTEFLVEHRIPERGARIYLTACREGALTAAELARLAGLHRVEAYRYIRGLEERGLLRPTGSRPARFVALPLDQLIDRWIRRTSDRLDGLRTGRDRLINEWREMMSADPEPDDVRKFAVLEGRAATHRFLRKRIDGASREIRLTVAGFALAPAIDGAIDRSLRAAAERGVRVRLVTEISAANVPEARHFAALAEVRHARTPVTTRAILVDRAGALVFVSGEDGLGTEGEHQIALWSSAPSVVALARGYHHRMWGHSVPIAQRLVELEGPAPTAALSVTVGSAAASFQRLKEITELGMRATGLPEVQLDLPDMIQALARQMGREISAQVTGQSPAEVARSLVTYYHEHALGDLEIARDRPLRLKVTGCFACTPQWPEIGRVLCPKMLGAVFEAHVGTPCQVSAPDPRRHATKGCQFTITPA
ncbi:MAG: helix-turn-helix domain-containing protein [Thermoplasmata archaeon]|nr:helix-turn-helix domain-containing protein [Thermoplasmata archaeon]